MLHGWTRFNAFVREVGPFRRPAGLDHFEPQHGIVRGHHDATTSSVQTRNSVSRLEPNVWVSETSAASRPNAMSTRPLRGALLRGSKTCQRPPR